MAVSPEELPAGRPFVLRVELQNHGVCPWIPGVGQQLQLQGGVKRLGLPGSWDYQGPWMVFGDRRVVELQGTTPKEPGELELRLSFCAAFRNVYPFLQKDIRLRWK
jgi:hypothetical protein